MIDPSILHRLAETLEARKSAAAETSYAAQLFARGNDAILKKVYHNNAARLLGMKLV